MGLSCLPYFIISSYMYLQSWEALPPESQTFSSDITPLILAAHLNHFEIVRMLLDRGATLPVPHDVRY
jgi:transient receptor potential cation channel subfamily C